VKWSGVEVDETFYSPIAEKSPPSRTERIGAHTKHELAATVKLSATASPRNMSPYNERNIFVDIDPSTLGRNIHFVIIGREGKSEVDRSNIESSVPLYLLPSLF
jgi:hypothetical protein